MKSKIFGLLDCNNFYASCERVFNPKLESKPIVVLSNNDGCIISRSNEAKVLGIPMGSPYYKQKELIIKNNVVVFSSNYQFYGDMSQRVMNSLGMFISDIEIYSIDEAFMRFDNLTSQDLFKDAINIRKKILQWTGIPTSLGIAHTKTLSKIANHIAKKKTKEGVFDMRSTDIQLRVMKDMPVEEIWGISRGWGDKLRSIGIYTALQLRNSNAKFVRSHLGVVLERIIYELRGLPCLEIEKISPKKSIVSSKSFGKPIGSIEPIEEALSSYASRACKKLRDQMSKTQELCVFISTNPFQQKKPQYRNSATFKFDLPTSDTSAVINKSKELLRLIYRQGYQYHKCGIMLLEIIPKNYNQGHFFSDGDSLNRDKTMKLVDNINNLMGPETLFYLSQGVSKSWKMQSKSRSLRYTTQWEEIPRIL